MVVTDLRRKFVAARIHRGSQVIFGERKHLEEVFHSIRKAKVPRQRKQAELRQLTKLISARTAELNALNPSWDRKFKKAHDPRATASELLRMAASLPQDDYLLARVLTEHAEAPGELLELMAGHPYSAVRENVARHPHTPPETLRKLAEADREPLWFLVACNPSTPPELRERLRARMKEMPTRET